MSRTNPQRVRDLIAVEDDIRLDRYLRMASVLTDQLAADDKDNELDDSALAEIETCLAAHFYQALRDKQYTSKSTGGASGSFQGSYAMVLSSTDPGQTAMLLDSTGYLAARSKQAEQGNRTRVKVHWLGTDDETTDDSL